MKTYRGRLLETRAGVVLQIGQLVLTSPQLIQARLCNKVPLVCYARTVVWYLIVGCFLPFRLIVNKP
jgi:hypothetical protein